MLRADARLPEQGQQGRFLFQCPCVRGYAAGRQAPFITDADRMPVVVLAVRSDSLQRASAVNPAVARDVEMVTDILETAVVVGRGGRSRNPGSALRVADKV